jgi:hypothetical protein
MKSFLKPLLFLSILLILGGVAYWDEWQSKKDAKEAAEKDKLVDFKAASIQAVRYQKRAEGDSSAVDIELRKENDRWVIAKPLAAPADAETIDRWLKTFEDLRFEKTFDAAPERLADYGLSQPQFSIALTTDAGQTITIQVGSKSPVGYSSYVKLANSPTLYLVSHYLFTASNKELQDFRDKSLGTPPLARVKKLSYQFGAEPVLTLVKQDKDWRMESPVALKADSGEIAGFFSFLERQRVERFIDQPTPEMQKALNEGHGGTQRIATLNFETEDGQVLQYAFLENNAILYTQIPGRQGYVGLDKKILEGLRKSARDFQFRGMFSFNSTDAQRVELDGKVFEKKDERWLLSGSNEEADFIRLMLVDLEFSKAEEVLSREKMSAIMQKPPLHDLKIGFKGGGKVDVAIWNNDEKPDTIYLTRDEEAFFLAKSQMLDNFEAQPKPSEKAKIGGEG